MLIGMRNAMLAGGGGSLSAKSYVQDGLVAMWDGIENAGWGVHDPNATVWKDLVGSNSISIAANYQTIHDNSVVFTATAQTGGKLSSVIDNMQSLEFCGGVSKGGETAIFANVVYLADSDVYPCIWYYNRSLGAGFLKNGFILDVNTSATLYADYTNSESDFSAKALNGIVRTGDGGKDFFRSSQKLGFGFRSTFPFSGTVYCLRAYSRALTAAEVAANYAVDKARFNLA